MAINLVIEHLNKRHNVRAGPLKPLSDVLDEVCNKVKPALDASKCKLLLKGTPQDLSTPLRFLNIPSGAKLELVSDRHLGIDRGQASLNSPNLSRGNVEISSELHSGGKSTVESSERAVQDGKASEEVGDVAVGEGDDTGERERLKLPSEAMEPFPTVQQEGESDQVAGENGMGSSSDAWASLPGVEREFCVYHRDTLVDESMDAAVMDVPDTFYEFTPEDYQRITVEHKARMGKEEAGLRTRALREKEEQDQAESLGAVHVRLLFESGTVCECQFRATDRVQAVYDFASSIVKCERAGLALFTAPPRVDLTDMEASLYKAKLVPAANVHVGRARPKKGMKTSGSSMESVELRDEVVKLKREHPPQFRPTVQPQMDRNTSTKSGNADDPSHSNAPDQGRVPKWMKLSK